MSHTYAVLQISRAAFDEIRSKFKDAGYEHAFDDAAEGGPVVDMHGVAVQAEPAPEADLSKFNFTKKYGAGFATDDCKKLANMVEAFRIGLDELCKRHHVRMMQGDNEDEIKIVVDCEPGFDEVIQASWNDLETELGRK